MLVLLWIPHDALGQEQRYSVSFHSISLADALRQLAYESSIPLVYSSDLVAPYHAHCIAENQSFEYVLSCILRESQLDFVRLSSGTYVVKERRELETLYGYFTGTVVDREHRAPIPNAHVYLSSRSGAQGTSTNEQGQFIFPKLVAGEYALSASHISYERWQDSVTVLPEQHIRSDISLDPEPILISPIVIDGLQHRHQAAELDHEEVSRDVGKLGHAGANPEGLLKRAGTLIGVRVSDVTADIHLQGADAGAHQIRLNGAPVFLPRSAVGVISPLGSFALSRLKVHKAGFGVGLGSQTAGVIQGDYNLDMVNRFASQVDLHSLNLQLQRFAVLPNEGSATFMLALRQGLWDVFHPSQLQNTIDNWGAPDPFVLFAPIKEYALATEDVFGQNLFEIRPGLSFNYSDLHTVTRIRLSPGNTIDASYYLGRTSLDSGDVPLAAFSPFFPDGYSSQDEYGWKYNVGQIRYNSVLSGRSLLTAQIRHSKTRSDHSYLLSYGLTSFEEPVDDSLMVFEFFGENVNDANRISELGGEVSLDFALPSHHFQVGVEAALTRSKFSLLLAEVIEDSYFFFDGDSLEVLPDTNFAFVDRYGNLNTSDAGRIAFYGEDRISLGPRWEATLGLRTTYLHGSVYPEPRVAFRYDHVNARKQAFSSKTSIGIYRQFINQVDISALNAGELLPSTRVWLPVDRTVSPAQTALISQAIAWKPSPSLDIRVEGYLNLQSDELAMNYNQSINIDSLYEDFFDRLDDLPFDEIPDDILVPVLDLEQRDFLTPVQTKKHGFNTALGWSAPEFRFEAQYSYSHATRKGSALFGGRRHTVPWNEPHRVDLQFDFFPVSSVTASIRTQSVWGRSWGFRRAYYDYFGHRESTRRHMGFDFGSPSEHVLPALHQVDISLAYTHKKDNALVQFRLDLLNALNTRNVIDWRLVYDSRQGTLVRKPRYLYDIMPVFAIRAEF